MKMVSGAAVKRRVLHVPGVSDAYEEARIRRKIAERLEAAMNEQGVSYRQLATVMGTGKSQVQRLLNKERGGSLTLLTLVKAARALGISVEELFVPEQVRRP